CIAAGRQGTAGVQTRADQHGAAAGRDHDQPRPVPLAGLDILGPRQADASAQALLGFASHCTWSQMHWRHKNTMPLGDTRQRRGGQQPVGPCSV
ncbi:unnamed protein product, partial [Closterium sp. Naga37s-1]